MGVSACAAAKVEDTERACVGVCSEEGGEEGEGVRGDIGIVKELEDIAVVVVGGGPFVIGGGGGEVDYAGNRGGRSGRRGGGGHWDILRGGSKYIPV